MPPAVETTDTTVAVLALVLAGLVAIVLVLVLLLLLQRRRNERRERWDDGIRSFEHVTPAEITSEAPPLVAEQVAWLRAVADIGATIQLEEVVSRSLAAAADVAGVDAALLVIDPSDGGEQLVATAGPSAAEGGILEPPMLPSVTGTRAAAVRYRYSEDREEKDGTLFREGLVLPLAVNDDSIGSLAVFSRKEGRQSDESIGRLEEVATRSALAIRNAQLFREAQTLGTLDPITALHSRSFFDDTLEHETARGSRYARPLALLILNVDASNGIDASGRDGGAETILVEFVESIHGMLRAADVPCRVGADQFAFILPESTLADAEQLYRRLTQKVTSAPAFADRIALSAGLTALSSSDTPASIFQRADEARAQARQTGHAQLEVAPPPES